MKFPGQITGPAVFTTRANDHASVDVYEDGQLVLSVPTPGMDMAEAHSLAYDIYALLIKPVTLSRQADCR